jgi:hypothetical protein
MDRSETDDGVRVPADAVQIPAQRRPLDEEPDEPTGGFALVALSGIVGLGVSWFGVSWRMLDSPVVDAIGEAFGGVVAVLVVFSAVGALRRSRRPPSP